MGTGDLTQTAINLIEGSGEIGNVIGNPFESGSFWTTIFQNDIRFRSAIIIFLLWISALIWVIKDANARSSSFWFPVLAAIIIILFTPILGLILYIAIRPLGFKWDRTPRRDTLFQQTQICENCGEFNQIEHSYCTSCGESLYTTCRECQSKYSKNYSYCPDCGAPRLEE